MRCLTAHEALPARFGLRRKHSTHPHTRNLALCVLAPNGAEAIRDIVRDDAAHRLALRGVAGRQDDQVGLELDAVGKEDAVLGQAVDLDALLDLDLAVGDEATAADVDVVPAAVAEVLDEEAARVGVELEAGLRDGAGEGGLEWLEVSACVTHLGQSVEKILVLLCNLLRRLDVELLEEIDGKRSEHQVGVVQGRAVFLVDPVEQSRNPEPGTSSSAMIAIVV